MKTISFFRSFLLFFALFSCTKVINVNLNNANPNIVIEGIVSDAPGPYQVKLTQTVNFSDPNIFPPVTGAIVKITDSILGVTDSLTEAVPGTYVTQKLQIFSRDIRLISFNWRICPGWWKRQCL